MKSPIYRDVEATRARIADALSGAAPHLVVLQHFPNGACFSTLHTPVGHRFLAKAASFNEAMQIALAEVAKGARLEVRMEAGE